MQVIASIFATLGSIAAVAVIVRQWGGHRQSRLRVDLEILQLLNTNFPDSYVFDRRILQERIDKGLENLYHSLMPLWIFVPVSLAIFSGIGGFAYLGVIHDTAISGPFLFAGATVLGISTILLNWVYFETRKVGKKFDVIRQEFNRQADG